MPTAHSFAHHPSVRHGRPSTPGSFDAARSLASLLSLVAMLASPTMTTAQAPNDLPFDVGERMTYHVKLGRFGAGRGAMWVEGPVDVRGTSTYLLRSEMQARVGFVKASDQAESWLDPLRMTALRYHKRERRALSGDEEQVELFPSESRWEEKGGPGGESPTDDPLDELSFIYFIRTLPLVSDTVSRIVRHYDRERNPIEVRVVGRDTIVTEAGVFPTIVVEMRVRDSRRYEGSGTIRLYLSDDARRIPVRIESSVPVVGRAVLTLATYTPSPRMAAAQAVLTIR
jgi:hypothetical protein